MSGSVQQPLETIDYLWVLARQVDRVAELCTGVFGPSEVPQKLRARGCLGAVWVLATLASPLVNTAAAKARLREAFQDLDSSVDKALRKAAEALRRPTGETLWGWLPSPASNYPHRILWRGLTPAAQAAAP